MDVRSIANEEQETSFVEQEPTAITLATNSLSSWTSRDDWSTSSEDNDRQVALNQLQDPAQRIVPYVVSITFINSPNAKNTTNTTNIHQAGSTVNKHFYCCSCATDNVLKYFWTSCWIATFISVFIALLIAIILSIWLANLKLEKQNVIDIDQKIIEINNVTAVTFSPKAANTTLTSDTSNSYNDSNDRISNHTDIKIIPRGDWGAAPYKKAPEKLVTLPTYIIFSETETDLCTTQQKCIENIRNKQISQMKDGSDDIAYNFLIGGDGIVYEGRGWNVTGDHTDYSSVDYDDNSIDISFIGSFDIDIPTESQLKAAIALIEYGVQNRKINSNYKLKAHKQLTYIGDNPGDNLYKIITRWKGWDNKTMDFFMLSDYETSSNDHALHMVVCADNSNNDETGFSQDQVAGTSSDDHAIVPRETFTIDESELSANQVAVATPNVIVNRSLEWSESDSWSTSTENYAGAGDLAMRMPNGANQLSVPNGYGPKFINEITGNTKPTTNFIEKTIYKGRNTVHRPITIHCCSLTVFDGSQYSCDKRYAVVALATLAGISIITFLFIWFLYPSVTKQQLQVPITTDSTTRYLEGLLNMTRLVTTISPDTTIDAEREISQNHFTTGPSNDYSSTMKVILIDSTTILSTHSPSSIEGRKEEKNETSTVTDNALEIITREEWDAASPIKPFVKLKVLPAACVIISETSTESCDKLEKCSKIIRGIQSSRSRLVDPQIEYNFLVASDGQIYEGRGWDVKGNVAVYFDHESINIAFIGNFSIMEPSENQVQAVLNLIQIGVENGHISNSYALKAKKQLVFMSDNPGEKLYNVIKEWKQWKSGTIGVDFVIPSEEYSRDMSYLEMFSGTKMKYLPKRGRN